MYIVGLDQAINNPGVVIHDLEKDTYKWFYTAHTIKEYKLLKKDPVKDVTVVKYDKFLDKFSKKQIISKEIVRFIQSNTVGTDVLVAMEDYAFGANGKLADIGEFTGLLKRELLKAGFFFKPYGPKFLKKLFASSGNAKKDEMLWVFEDAQPKLYNDVLSKLGKSDDLVDAFFLHLLGYYDYLLYTNKTTGNEKADDAFLTNEGKVRECIFEQPFYIQYKGHNVDRIV